MEGIIKVRDVYKTYHLILANIKYMEVDVYKTLTVYYIDGSALAIKRFKSDDIE